MGLAGTLATRAQAQSEEDLAQARTQFAEGVQLVEEERWDEALTRFRAVARVRSTPQVLYNLALARAHTDGGEPEAARILERVQRDTSIDPDTATRARELMAQVEPHTASLVLTVDGDEAGTRVTVDGEEVELGDLGRPYRVAPGSHVVELRWGTHIRDHREVRVAAGGREELALDAAGTYEDDIANAALDGGGTGTEPPVTDQWWFWAAIGAGAVIVLGIVIGVSVSAASSPSPIEGNLSPGVLRVMP